jgi:hypothetical protein
MTFEPQLASRSSRIHLGVAPPRSFIASSVHLAVVTPAQWNRKFIADFAIERPTLRKSYVMSISRASAANQTGMLSDKFDVIRVTYSASFRHAQRALINWSGSQAVFSLPYTIIECPRIDRAFGSTRSFRFTRPEFIKLDLESVLYGLSIRLCQLVLFSKFLMGPVGRVIT